MTDYKPIACADYDLYEIAIMHGADLDLCWQSGSEEVRQQVTPKNLRTHDGAEYLLALSSTGELLEIRLDRIGQAREI